MLNRKDAQILGSVFTSVQNNPGMTKATFSARTERKGVFPAGSLCKGFQFGNHNMEGKNGYTIIQHLPNQFSGERKEPRVSEGFMASLGACITQTIIMHATALEAELNEVRIDAQDDVDLRGFLGLSKGVIPEVQQFRVNVHIVSPSASKDH